MRQGIIDGAMRIFFLAPFRCRKCRSRFYRLSVRATFTRSWPVPPRELAFSILLLDNDRSLRRLFRRMLEKEGYLIHEASSCNEATRELRGESLDLVIANLHYPTAFGLTALRAMRETYPKAKIIALSDPDSAQQIQAEIPGKLAILQKPLSANALLGSVRTLLATADLHRA